ncbi:MAG: 3,4-dihydroxy-2-butanone-4-phosphate synthase, partial [Candidatus Altiarchaeota archaeon]|nr:3,4-dihydroxy-2-butanone-4-phosphate synthase [Candidatus Altiarchaeota archaeon]
MVDDSILEGLREGNFVLIHDSTGRENETDLVMAAGFVKAEDIVRMRGDGGGLICVAVGREISERLGLPFMSDLLESGSKSPVTEYLKADDIPYDEKSSFSVSINHRNTFTGITDLDRALTIREFAVFCRDLGNDKREVQKKFGSKFRSSGHV